MARKPYSLSGEATPTMVDRIDKMLKELYRDSSSSHNLLSTQHGDTVATTAVRASMIIADSDNLWAMVTPDTGGTFPRYDGADVTFAAVSETDIGRVREGGGADFRVDAYPDRRFHGVVSQVRYADEIAKFSNTQ